jgi:uncharacterized protein
MATALITGGTSGIGAAFGRALARRGYDLVLVARDEANLAKSADEFRTLGAPSVETISADLADRTDVTTIADRLSSVDAPIDLLVNNAGFGVHFPLATRDTSVHDRAIEVMIRTVLVLGGAAAKAMKTRGSGAIINVSSTAGFVTMGGYSAIKAWVTSYTEGLAVELRGSGVRVTALCPGWVRTEFHERANIRTGSIPSALWVDVDLTVEKAIKDSDRGRVISIPTARFTALIWLARHIPRSTVHWVSAKISSGRRDPESVDAH